MRLRPVKLSTMFFGRTVANVFAKENVLIGPVAISAPPLRPRDAGFFAADVSVVFAAHMVVLPFANHFLKTHPTAKRRKTHIPRPENAENRWLARCLGALKRS